MPNCIILRGLPGSGKSTIAKGYKALYPSYMVVSADNFFYHLGQYKFERDRLADAHRQCRLDFMAALNAMRDVVVDNTNLLPREYNPYIEIAEGRGYTVTTLTVETTLTDEELAARNIHGVPVETIRRMRERMIHG